MAGDQVWHEIVAERVRAHAKHGATSMESCDPFADRRLRVLVEEVGEVARVLNDREHEQINCTALWSVVDELEATALALLRSELVQVAAMAVAWIAALDGEALPVVAPAWVLQHVLEHHGAVDFGVVEIDGRWHSFSITPDIDGNRRGRYAAHDGHATRAAAIADMRTIADEYDRLTGAADPVS